jgi:ADP-ribose pyrophosphatase YjhB (NUDIX family)
MASYMDPKVAAAAVVRDPAGLVYLLRRAQRDQAHGLWILPGGHVDRGEEVHAAAVREVGEEIGLSVRLQGLLGVYSYPGNPVVLVVYAALSDGREPNPGREALEVRGFAPEELPWDSLGYPSTGHALRDILGLAAVPARPAGPARP